MSRPKAHLAWWNQASERGKECYRIGPGIEALPDGYVAVAAQPQTLIRVKSEDVFTLDLEDS